MTNPQHEALVEAVAAAIEQELDVQEMLLADPMTLRRLKARRIARAAIAALSATAATPSDEVVRLQSALKGILGSGKTGTWKAATEPLVARFDVAAKFGGDTVHNQDGSAALAELLRSMAETLDTAVLRARAALEPQGKGTEQ